MAIFHIIMELWEENGRGWEGVGVKWEEGVGGRGFRGMIEGAVDKQTRVGGRHTCGVNHRGSLHCCGDLPVYT